MSRKEQATKKTIARALKDLMRAKSFEDISVTDITKRAGISRNSFYYHFTDKYELLNWIYYDEVILVIKRNFDQATWVDHLTTALWNIKKEKAFYQNALVQNDEFRTYMYSAVTDLFSGIINGWMQGLYAEQEDILFVSKFFSYGIVGMVIDWIRHDMPQSPESMIEYTKNLLEDIKMIAISRYLSTAFSQDDEEQ